MFSLNPFKWGKEPLDKKIAMISDWLKKHAGHKVTLGPAPYASFNCTGCHDEILVSNHVMESIKSKVGLVPAIQGTAVLAAMVKPTDATDGKERSDPGMPGIDKR